MIWLRRLGVVLALAGAIGFGVTFVYVNTHACEGEACFEQHSDPGGVGFAGSIMVGLTGAVIVCFGGGGAGSASGPRTFDEVAAGQGDPHHPAKQPKAAERRPRRWTRWWANAYTYSAAFQFFLGGLFLFAAINVHATIGGYLPGGVLVAVGVGLAWAGLRAKAADRLHETGLQGTATITGLQQTGMWMNNNPVVVLDLRVELDGHPPYNVRHRETVPQILIGRLTDGSTLPVRVDPHNPSHLIIVWEQV